ncbi:MAG TPA: type II secretion system secretin GspD, partial [Gammaproteobacteria bacterium]|nr:type II secretion system secretin GspD [Gammaproteobacteria bacterium]
MSAAPAAPGVVASKPRKSTTIQLAAFLGLALSLSGTLHAQPQYTANYRDADIRAIIDQVSQITGKTIIVDPRVRAQVTVFSNGPLSADAFYQLFVAMLEVHGFVPLESGGAIEVVPDANARTGQGADFITQAVVLKNVGAVQLVPVLRPLLPQSAHLAAVPSANALLIADRANNLNRIINIIRRLDTAGTMDMEVIALENASADEVARMIGQLNTTAQAAGGTPPVVAIADTRTNSILLSGAEPTRLQYRAMITHLDTPSAQGGDTLVKYLNYADAEDLAMKLQAQFGGSGGGGGGAPPPAGGEGAAAVPGNGPITIWADPGTNALVINAPERVRQDILAVIAQIDIPRLQVQVDAIIVELTRKKAAELGVTWAIDGSDNDSAVGLTNFSSTTGGIVQLGTAASGQAPSPNLIRDGLTLGLGHIRDGGTSWAAIISALAGDGDTNIVSTPTIVTLDNEEAEIKVGQEVPFVTGQYTSTGGNNNGNVNPFTTINREEVGTRLKIKPQINEGNGVKLTIEQETSSISGSAAGAVDLVTNKRTITTAVFVDDGDILVLGGLS